VCVCVCVRVWVVVRVYLCVHVDFSKFALQDGCWRVCMRWHVSGEGVPVIV